MIQFHQRCPNLPSKSQDLKNQRNTLHIAACFNVEPQLLEAGKIDQIARNKMDTDGYTDIHEWYANKMSISVIIHGVFMEIYED